MTDQHPEAPAVLAQQLTEAADRHRENLLYTAPEFYGERWDQFRGRLRDIAAAYEPAETPDTGSPAPVPADPAAASTETVTALPVAAALDREGVRQLIRNTLNEAWLAGEPKAEMVADAIWPLLEHAQEAAAGSREGVRLWMLDCAELTAEHARHAEVAEAKLAGIEAHAPAIVDALRPTLAYVEHVPNPSSQAAAERYRNALAIIGTEGDGGDGH